MAAVARRRKDDKSDEPSGPSILQKLAEEQQQRAIEEEFSSDVSIVFCGAKKSGKTSLIDRFINQQKDEKDQPKPTVALDYRFARYSSDTSTSKVLAHIYDVGGDEGNDGLASLSMSAGQIGNLVAAVVVDLSEPHDVIPSLEKWLALLREQVSQNLARLAKESQSGAQRVEALAKAKQAIYADHPDERSVRPFPVPLVIFGAKFDALMADVDPEKRKVLCKGLRHFAHVNGATLITSSIKDKASMKLVWGVLRQHLFGVATKGAVTEQLDPNKPLYVSAGKDSIQAIGVPQGSQGGDKAWRDVMAGLFPDPQPAQKGPKKTESELVTEELQKYQESAVDGMVEQRIEELNQYRRQVERNQRLASEGVDGSKITALTA